MLLAGVAGYAQVLQGSISAVPEAFYGLWRVKSVRIDTDSPAVFKEKGVDIWNISRENNVILLSNPFSGASAQVKVNHSEQGKVVFTKNGKYDNKILNDTVSIKITGDSFTGEDELILDTVSDVDGKIIKTEKARYSLVGERIAGKI